MNRSHYDHEIEITVAGYEQARRLRPPIARRMSRSALRRTQTSGTEYARLADGWLQGQAAAEVGAGDVPESAPRM